MKMRIDEVNELIQESKKKLHEILYKMCAAGFGSLSYEEDALVKEHDEELKKYSQLQVEKAFLERNFKPCIA